VTQFLMPKRHQFVAASPHQVIEAKRELGVPKNSPLRYERPKPWLSDRDPLLYSQGWPPTTWMLRSPGTAAATSVTHRGPAEGSGLSVGQPHRRRRQNHPARSLFKSIVLYIGKAHRAANAGWDGIARIGQCQTNAERVARGIDNRIDGIDGCWKR